MKLSRAVAASLGLSTFLCAALSGATPGFPGAVKTELSLSYSPPCLVCHQGTPGPGTVTTGFGSAMRERGLKPNDTASLKAALAKLGTDGVDSDKDGTSDVDALKAGKNPNDGSTLSTTTAGGEAPDGDEAGEPKTGCGAHVAPSTKGSAAGLLAVAGLFGLVAARRRRR